MNPAGCLTSIQSVLTKLRKERRIDLFQAYVRGPRFREHFAHLPPEHVEACIIALERTRKACRLPAAPKPIGTGQLSWTMPLKAKLGRAYAKFGPKAHVAVAAEMKLTVGQVRLAKRRYLDSQCAEAISLPLAA